MGTITGLTADRMLEIEDESIVSGRVTGNDLILTTKGGDTVVAGNVRGPQGDRGKQIWVVQANVANISAVAGSVVGDTFLNSDIVAHTILGVNTAPGALVVATSATAGLAAGVLYTPFVPTVLNSSDTTTQTGASGADVTYTTVSVALTPGTWKVEGWATMYSTGAADTKLLALYNVTGAAEVLNSRSGSQAASAVNVLQSFYTSAVLTVAVNTTIRMLGKRNGGSVLVFGGNGAISIQRLMATKLAN